MNKSLMRFSATAGLLALSLFPLAATSAAAAEAKDQAQLAKSLSGAKATLQKGLQSGASHGKPISAKFEMEDGKLQLSVYTLKKAGYSEVVIDPNSGKVLKTETITDKEDLENAAAQKAAMAKAKKTLLAAVDHALKANSGYRAISVIPEVKADHAVAEVTLARGEEVKTVSEPLDK
ncbi:MAG TPA: PepSY domain-containing protein [Usitatibacter sp.]|nr:PepSY domain-containing protein [Usitatibacter sp.]